MDWDNIGPQIRALFEAQTWISIPGGPVDSTVRKGQAVILSNGKDDMSFWAAGPYLSYQGYSYKTVDADGNDSHLYDTLCNLLGLGQKAPAPPSVPDNPQEEGSEEALAQIDAIIKGAEDDLRLEYFADGASGPSLVHSGWENSDVDELNAIISAYAWERTGEPPDDSEWTEEMKPPEGGAYRMRLRGKSGFCEMDYGYSKRLCFRGVDGSADYIPPQTTAVFTRSWSAFASSRNGRTFEHFCGVILTRNFLVRC